MTDLDLNRALMLTYAGVGAAFIVLGSLIVYTLLIGWLGNLRARRHTARRQSLTAAIAASPQPQQSPPASNTAAANSAATAPAEPPNLAPQLAAAIAVAVAQAIETRRRESAETAAQDPAQTPLSPADSTGWKEQGRIAAFDTRRRHDRER